MASRFGMGLRDLQRPDGHERGRKWFPALADRLHLGAVIAKCGAFCAYAEAFVKNFQINDPERHLRPEQLWPEEAPELVERYNRHLNLDLLQQIELHHNHQKQEVQNRTYDLDDDYGL